MPYVAPVYWVRIRNASAQSNTPTFYADGYHTEVHHNNEVDSMD
ncbi:hypothetical protein [Alteromonas sp. BL110]|nr:hypothetical protein [Alteromonas sp. BL110]